MTQEQANNLAQAFRGRFNATTVEMEEVNANGRYRFAIVSPVFERMTQLQRQDAAWEIVDGLLLREQTLDISLILTYAPPELVA